MIDPLIWQLKLSLLNLNNHFLWIYFFRGFKHLIKGSNQQIYHICTDK